SGRHCSPRVLRRPPESAPAPLGPLSTAITTAPGRVSGVTGVAGPEMLPDNDGRAHSGNTLVLYSGKDTSAEKRIANGHVVTVGPPKTAASRRLIALVRRVGLEPTTRGLRVRDLDYRGLSRRAATCHFCR
ncbi:MAG: hypothetical protein QOE52_4746, partial [Mycobacterium sp.]|nr:hypothetical protein [Mycobacterium sp.]